MQLIDEGDDPTLGGLDLLQHRLQSLFELAPIFGPGHHGREIQAQHTPLLEGVRHITGDHSLSQALNNCGLADSGLTDQDRVVLGTPRQHLHHAADLGVTTDHRIKATFLSASSEINGVFFQGLVFGIAVLAGHAPLATMGLQGLASSAGGDCPVGQHSLGTGLDFGESEEEVLGGHEFVAVLVDQIHRLGQHPRQGRRGRGGGDGLPTERGQRGQCTGSGGLDARCVCSGLGQDLGNYALVLVKQGPQQVQWLDLRIVLIDGKRACRIDHFDTGGGQLRGIHSLSPSGGGLRIGCY